MSYDSNGYDDMSDIDEEMDQVGWLTDDDVSEKPVNLFLSSIDESEVSRRLNEVPHHAQMRAVLDRTIRLNQLLGDKDGQIADLTRDIESEIYLLALELRRDPSRLILASLTMLSEEEQVVQIIKMLELLAGRLEALTHLEVQ